MSGSVSICATNRQPRGFYMASTRGLSRVCGGNLIWDVIGEWEKTNGADAGFRGYDRWTFMKGLLMREAGDN